MSERLSRKVRAGWALQERGAQKESCLRAWLVKPTLSAPPDIRNTHELLANHDDVLGHLACGRLSCRHNMSPNVKRTNVAHVKTVTKSGQCRGNGEAEMETAAAWPWKPMRALRRDTTTKPAPICSRLQQGKHGLQNPLCDMEPLANHWPATRMSCISPPAPSCTANVPDVRLSQPSPHSRSRLLTTNLVCDTHKPKAAALLRKMGPSSRQSWQESRECKSRAAQRRRTLLQALTLTCQITKSQVFHL